MSSSSSTACDCFYCQYGMGYACSDYRTCPFYPTMGQPYVYYAQVPRNQMDRRKNPNFFVKAFRWYTQEHTPPAPSAQAHYTETSTSAPAADLDVAGFANWLDAKYEQFLREGRAFEERCVVVTQTSEGMGAQPQCQSQPGGNKRFTRIRLQSPWKKRRCHTNMQSEGGDVPIGSNMSVVYLLEPKDLPRPISECCQVSSTPCCSVSTVVKKVNCSRSATNTFTRCDVEHIDPVSMQEGIPSSRPPQAAQQGCKQECPKKSCPDSKSCLQKATSNIDKNKSRSKSKIAGLFKAKKTENPVNSKNVSCECSTLPAPRPMVDAETQYDLVVKYACECISRPAVSNAVSAAVTPVPTAPVALAETKPKQTWFQRSLLKIPSPKTSKPQKDVECQCEPDPKVDKNQYCTQCGCRCTEMREKLLCCECVRTSCLKEASAHGLLTEQSPPPSTKCTEYAPKQDTPLAPRIQTSPQPNMPSRPPLPMQQLEIISPPPPPTTTTTTTSTTKSTPLQEQYLPKLDMPPIPQPKSVQQQCAPRPDMMPAPRATSWQQEYAQKLDMTPLQQDAPKQGVPPLPSTPPSSPSVSAPKPQPMLEVSVVTQPQQEPPPPSQQPPCEPPLPEKSQPYAIKGRLLRRTSFPCTICSSAQTSDHAINLDQGTVRGYPLFLKIVCADRLNEDCLCRQ